MSVHWEPHDEPTEWAHRVKILCLGVMIVASVPERTHKWRAFLFLFFLFLHGQPDLGKRTLVDAKIEFPMRLEDGGFILDLRAIKK